MAKHVKHEEHENHERWLVSYADFITLLFAFFVVLWSLGQTEAAKVRKTMEAIREAFMSGGGIFPLRGQPFSPFESAPGKGSATPSSPMDSGLNPKSDDIVERIQEDLQSLFEKNTGMSVTPNDLSVVQDRDGFRIRLGERMLFDGGSDRLKRQHAAFLLEVGKKLQTLNLPIQVEGHSDNQGDENDNWQLSLERASNVVQFMVKGADFPKNKISVAGFGNTQPLFSNMTAEGRRRNRRVEIAVHMDTNKIKELPW